jgi:hypothetical protein
MKPCSKCLVTKPLSDFHKNKSNRDGLQSQCKDCRHVVRVSKWETSPLQQVVRVRNGVAQTYSRTRNHGESKSVLYTRWKKIKERCYNLNAQNYRFYGGKGVAVCDEWRNDFFSFKSWAIAAGFQEHMELDRIDSEGPYSPDNCRWLPSRENIKRSKTLLSTDTAAKLSEDCVRLSISADALIANILEEHYSRENARLIGGDA